MRVQTAEQTRFQNQDVFCVERAVGLPAVETILITRKVTY